MENCEEIQCPRPDTTSSDLTKQTTTSSTSTFFTKCTNSSIFAKLKDPANIQHELNCGKAALQKCSDISGENLFDHLSSIIKRVLDQRPENVVDYFEEYSRNVREQKFNVVENFTKAYFVEPIFFEAAENVFASIKMPPESDECEGDECKLKPNLPVTRVERLLTWNESVLLSQFYWSLCGFGFQFDEVFHLSWILQKLQFHPTVQHCRFWGKIYGLKKNYYIAEVTFTQTEIEKRNEKYINEFEFKSLRDPEGLKPIRRRELIPGSKWKNCPKSELATMQPEAAPVPLPKLEEQFNIPAESYGSGVNRRSYFVITTLTEEWVELPFLDVKEMNIARKIKKYFTGDLEELLFSYPRFPGCEKNYLRATIARITCGTYIAPDGFYRKQTKKDLMGDEMEEEEEEEEENDEEGDKIDNDVILLKNKKYSPMVAPEIGSIANWVHVRPNILDNQGRIVYFNQEKAIKELLKKRKLEEKGEIELEEDEEEEGEEEVEDEYGPDEVGPSILNSCREDDSKAFIPAWTSRYSAVHNIMNQVMIMRSNIWPGSYSFASDQMADSIYLGWGHKYTARNFSPTHIPGIQQEYFNKNIQLEIPDPTPKEFAESRNKVKHKITDYNLDKDDDEIREDIESDDSVISLGV